MKNDKIIFTISLFLIISLIIPSVTSVLYFASNNELHVYSPITDDDTLIKTFNQSITEFFVGSDDKNIVVWTGFGFNNNTIHISTDYGVTFSSYIVSSVRVRDLFMSPDGSKIYLAWQVNNTPNYDSYFYVFNTNNFPTILYSYNLNCSTSSLNLGNCPTSVVTNTDGQYIDISGNSGITKYRSNNYGSNFTSFVFPFSRNPSLVSISPNGQYHIASGNSLSGWETYKSNDYGVTYNLTMTSSVIQVTSNTFIDNQGTYLQWWGGNTGLTLTLYRNISSIASNTNYINYYGNSSIGYSEYTVYNNWGLYNKSRIYSFTNYNTSSLTSIKNFTNPVTVGYQFTISDEYSPEYVTVPYNPNFIVTLDTINANQQLDGSWYTYPYGIPLQSYATVKVTTPQTGYIGIQCNFNESTYFSDKFEYTDNNISNNGWTGSCKNYYQLGQYRTDYQKSLYVNGTTLCGALVKSIGELQNGLGYTLTFTLKPLTDGRFELSLNNIPYGNTKVANVIFDYDELNNTMCVYYDSVNPITGISCFNYNTSINGDLGVQLDINNYKATYTISFDTLTTDRVYSNNLNMLSGSEVSPETIGYMSIESGSTFEGWLDNINITSHGYFPNIVAYNSSEFVGDAYYQGCPYGQIYNVPITIRTYYQPDNIQVWNNFKDIRILPRTSQQQLTDGNVTGQFDQNQQNFIDSLFGSGLSTGEKLFDVLMWLVVATLLMIIFGFSFDMSAGMVGALVTVVDLIILVFFAYIGFIPVWIIICIGIIASAIIAMGAKKMIAQ